ncbi:MAG: ABC transporter ATP-binding protein [Candidatus Dadabacteria bacterium]|nr:ABC transporter ATP-binding protein [Candidatus Dadabacteria bacterium]MYA48512.1 ABC transporter ATP-binding protein [Candidatus Dadabacteria bacterium]MYF48394.1 ABC transporter ATP-binding protein [Candidatus Dadabacteria bacterium]MYG82524.1 ABC transporter ATP-binding protein [Candidatus Dadabacteria bacterium]MYK49994.1 ABC transporter ATP-binding protein [Candidatus Dadabacteria bacterium]
MSDLERNRKSTYDLKILRWILGFLGKYRGYFALSLLLMIATAALEITVPYLIKVAVDDYIYPTWSKAEGGGETERMLSGLEGKSVLALVDGGFLVDFSKLSSSEKDRIERSGVEFSETKYIVVNPGEFEGDEKQEVLGIIARNASLFERTEGVAFLPHSDLDSLSKEEVSLLRSKQTKRLGTLALYVVLSVIGIFVFTSAFTYILHYSGQKIMHDMRNHTLSHILSLPQQYFDQNPVGRITTRVTNDVNAINEMYTSVLIHFIKDIIIIIGTLVIMFRMNVGLTLIIVGLTAFLTFTVSIFRMKLRLVYREIRRTIAKLNAFVAESMRGIVLLKLYGKEERNFEKFWEVNRENYRANIRQLWVYVIFRPSIEYVGIAATGIILWYGAIGVMNLDLSLGALLAFLYYVRMIFKPIQELSEKFNVFQSAVAASENLYDTLAEKPEATGSMVPVTTEGTLEFRGVWFSYNEREWVLKDASFAIGAGQSAALVGITGAGKTTIVNLILKFYKPQRGEILFNGVNVEELSNEYLRSNVTAIFQDLFLFEKDVSDERDQRDGPAPETQRLSSGQTQARSIEKAVRKNSKLLIMDEATSHLDAETEERIQGIIRKNAGAQTRLIITHKLSTLKNVDNVIVIHKGEVVEQGTHEKLLENENIYYTLYEFLRKTAADPDPLPSAST